VQKIYYPDNNTILHLYDNETREKESFPERNKIISCLYKIKNAHQEKLRYIHNNLSGVYLKKINFLPVSDLNEINAASYIYCGLTNFLQENNIGIALDSNGYLLIIKGKSNNLIKGIYKKFINGYHYQSANLTNGNNEIKFNHLYINHNGILTGEEQKTNKHYCISIDKISSPLETSEQNVTIHLSQYKKTFSDETLTLQTRDMNILYLHYQRGKLFLDKIKTPANEIDYSIMEYDIQLPVKKNYLIQSIKKVKNHLQIELRKEKKSRIVYLNPDHISLKKLTARKLSHKPPQNFISRLGCDPHEKYHAGQPFTSDRKGNFSSDHIPLFSSIIDKFRVHLQSAKNHKAQGKNKKSFISITKSIDPGLSALYEITVDRIRKIRKNTAQHGMTDQQIMFTSMQSQTASLIPIINHALGNTLPLDLSDALISLMKKLNVRESINLQNSNIISGFFGVAAGGLPFNPGWFAGVVAMLARSYHLVLSRVDTNNISVTFNYQRKKSSIFIAGTGQGLERSLLSTRTINYMTVMPAEANLIIVTHCTKERNFSFTLSITDFELFARQLYHPENNNIFNQQLINQSTLKEIREKELLIMLESKSEVRAQIGALVNPTTYMVMPRTALGVRLALNLIELKSVSEKTITHQGKTRKNNLTVTLSRPEVDLFHETKIMPIAMRQGVELWCYPLPLIEEYRPTNIIHGKKTIIFTTETPEQKTPHKKKESETLPPDKNYDRPFSLMEIDKIPLTIIINKSLAIDKHRFQKSKLGNKQISLLVEKLEQVKKILIQQERDNLYKQCKVFLYCHYDNYEEGNGIKKYQLTKIEIRRITKLNHLTATIPLAIISLANNNAISYDELLGEVDFLYRSRESNIPYNINFNLHILY
jgi:hypothetical protein